VIKLTIVHWQRKRQQHHHHQHTSCRTIVNTFTSPDNLDYLTYLQYLKFSDYQVGSVKNTKPFRDLHTRRWLALHFWEVVGWGSQTHPHWSGQPNAP
jgi:hypothetical protein